MNMMAKMGIMDWIWDEEYLLKVHIIIIWSKKIIFSILIFRKFVYNT